MAKSSMNMVARDVVVEGYRLLSVGSVEAPADGAGDDWLQYRIGQGNNVVTGYRRGNRLAATAEIERIVDALNERLLVKQRPHRSAGPKAPPRHKDIL